MRSNSQISPKWTKRWRAVAASATVTLACGLLIAGGDPAGADDVGALHVDNPYAGATGYVNPDWRPRPTPSRAAAGSPTSRPVVWLDRIAAIDGSATARWACGRTSTRP